MSRLNLLLVLVLDFVLVLGHALGLPSSARPAFPRTGMYIGQLVRGQEMDVRQDGIVYVRVYVQ